jgi:hypothetical protein
MNTVQEKALDCTRHEDASGIYYTVMSESDPSGLGYYTVRFNKIGFPSDNCKAGRQGQGCKHKLAAVQAETEYQAQQHENSSVKRSGLKAYEHAPFSLLKVTPTIGAKEGQNMTAKKLTSMNIAAGDVPETDQEVEKILEKTAKKSARKTSGINPLTGAKKLSLSEAQAAASGALPQQQIHEITPMAAPVVKGKRQAKVKSVVVDGNLQVVTDRKSKAALMRAEKRAKATTTKNGNARVTAETAQAVLAEMAVEGADTATIAAKHKITPRRVKSIVAGRTWASTTGVQKKAKK